MTTKKVPETETDHEFRLRMAREGRAIYTPGRSVEEVKAELAASAERAQRPIKVAFDVTEAEFAALDTALPDAVELIEDAAEVFAMLAETMRSADVQVGMPSVLRLAARAMRSAQGKEIVAIEKLDSKLRGFGARRAKALLGQGGDLE